VLLPLWDPPGVARAKPALGVEPSRPRRFSDARGFRPQRGGAPPPSPTSANAAQKSGWA